MTLAFFLDFWTAASALLIALLAVLGWFEARHPHALDWLLGPIHEDLDAEWAAWDS